MKAFLKTVGVIIYDAIVATSMILATMFGMFVMAALGVRTYLEIVPVAPIVGWAVIAVILLTAGITFEWAQEKSNATPTAQRITAYGRSVAFYVIFFLAATLTVVANATMWVAEKAMNQAEHYQK